MSFRVSQEEVDKRYKEYMEAPPPFEPFKMSDADKRKIAERYSNVLSTQNGEGIDIYNIEPDKIQNRVQSVPKGGKILLLGVGVGYETMVAKSLGFRAIGITLGSRNIDFGRRIIGLDESEHIECTIDVLPFPKETFDAVIGFQLLEHTIAPLVFLLEQSRILKFGGKLILEWPPAKEHAGGGIAHHQICFTPGQAEALFQKADFGDIKVYYGDGKAIPEEHKWRADVGKYMYIEGTKVKSEKPYVMRAWDM